jgi:hypothetical protein
LAIKKEEMNGTELSELKALVADQQQRLEMLEELQAPPSNGDGSAKEHKATRRQLIKLAGAALMGAAGTAALKAIPASAANGQAMVVGTIATQDLSFITGLHLTGTASPPEVFSATAFGGTNAGFVTGIYGAGSYNAATGGVGVMGYTGGTQTTRSGVMGYTYSQSPLSVGVLGAANYSDVTFPGAGIGVVAYSGRGDGLHASTKGQGQRAIIAYTSATGAVGLSAYSSRASAIVASGYFDGVASYASTGAALRGVSFSKTGASALGVGGVFGGPDAKLGGSGRFIQAANISGGVGAPNITPSIGTNIFGHSYFESVRADDGALWITGALKTGTNKSRWKRVNAVRVDSSDGLGTPFTPFRLVNTRTGAKPAANSTIKFLAAGQGGTGKSHIPADAIAVIGNLTATQYSGGGFLTISPAGVNVATSTVNFITGQAAIANSFIVGLGVGGANQGRIQVHVSNNTACHYLVDITGYIQ